jgi:hypothetical protein
MVNKKRLLDLFVKDKVLKWNRSYLCITIVMTLICGCTTDDMRFFYGEGQDWQRKQCRKMPGQNESNECVDKTNVSYDDYKYKIEKTNK